MRSIRALDLAGAMNLDVAGALIEKMEYNANRARSQARESCEGRREEVLMWPFKRNALVAWSFSGELYYGDFVDHPSKKLHVAKFKKVSHHLICHPDGTVEEFNGGGSYIKGWRYNNNA